MELATAAEVVTGTDLLRAITPAGLRAGLNASGAAPIFACRAWVNFNGMGTVAIRASGNVSSITDNGTGDYTINFATAMQDTNYILVGTGSAVGSDGRFIWEHTSARTASNIRIRTNNSGQNLTDSTYVNVTIIR